ncbi:MAG: GAF domain-containing protein, partial [Anaerolineae bacterium]|nr:GAF domain-containing protein [Anaerolineae bacterium]
DASAAVSSTLEFGPILQRIAQRLIDALQLEHVIITSWERDSSHLMSLVEFADAYWLPVNGPVQHLPDWPSKQSVIKNGRPNAVAIEDINPQHPEYQRMLDHGWRFSLNVPLVIESKIVGLVMVCSEKGDTRFHLKHVKAIEQTIEGWREHVLATSNAAWYDEENVDTLVQQIRKAVHANWIEVGAWAPAENALHIVRQVGHLLWTEDAGMMWKLNSYHSMAFVVQNSEPITVSIDELKNDPAEREFMQQIGGKTLLLVPLFIRGKPAGVLKLVRSSYDLQFDSNDISLCQGIANVVGNAVENSQLYSSLEQRAAALEVAYTELKKIDQLKDDLLQNISHELRTPLTHILGYVNLMQDDAFGATTPEQQETLNILMRKTQHLADLIKDMVAVQATPDNLNLRALQLDRVVAMAVRNMSSKATEANIRIDMNIPANLPMIAGDVVRLSEAIEALIDNAIKFSPGSNHIEISAQDSAGPVVQLSVKDFGIGIPVEEHDKIFQRFYQVDSSTTRRFGGTGLGLALVKNVVTAHSGHIWLESEPSKGST